ncbi:hypothetical protein R1sor_018354 [Riccia sorocarpa]|uniref:AT1G08220-like protein n=1 Tax=Riccia sorocarpa TaxID=122646 RepID=A0ABD3IDJ1_9MARC
MASGRAGLVFHLASRLRAPVLLRAGDLFPAETGSVRHLNIFTIFSKEAREKERARLADELNRGYFDDFKELKKTGGKVASASQNLLPAVGAVQFPKLTTYDTRGGTVILPISDAAVSATGQTSGPKQATLVCLAFRASAQSMIESWTTLFRTSFHSSQNVELFHVSVVDSWFLSLRPVKSILLRTMRSPVLSTGSEPPGKALYSFGDSYYFRKQLGIPNVLSGYVFLLDKKGRVRWRASGFATSEELASMISCIERLLEEH